MTTAAIMAATGVLLLGMGQLYNTISYWRWFRKSELLKQQMEQQWAGQAQAQTQQPGLRGVGAGRAS